MNFKQEESNYNYLRELLVKGLFGACDHINFMGKKKSRSLARTEFFYPSLKLIGTV